MCTALPGLSLTLRAILGDCYHLILHVGKLGLREISSFQCTHLYHFHILFVVLVVRTRNEGSCILYKIKYILVTLPNDTQERMLKT